jgi:peptide/nickel transport system ATP-binding protein
MVEYAETEKIFANPLNPYTQALFSAIPIPDPDVKINRIILKGSIPSPANPPRGCKFHTRCEKCMEVCKYAAPVWKEVVPGHFCACHLYDDAAEKKQAEETMEQIRRTETEPVKEEMVL